MTQLFADNATTTLASSLAAGATSVNVGSSTGFPTLAGSDYFYCTFVRASDSATEIVKVTAVAGTTWTIARAQDGTTALAFVTGDKAELRLTAAGLSAIPGTLIKVTEITTSGTFTADVRTSRVLIKMVGGGGGGNAANATSSTQFSGGVGGASGGYTEHTATSGFSSATVTIGAGGAGSTDPGTNNNVGGQTVFAATGFTLRVPGGSTSNNRDTVTSATALSIWCGAVGPGFTSSAPSPGNLCYIPPKQGTGIIFNSGQVGTLPGGDTPLGGPGYILQGTEVVAGAGYGYGGGSCLNNSNKGSISNGQAGGSGVVIVYEYA